MELGNVPFDSCLSVHDTQSFRVSAKDLLLNMDAHDF